MTSLKRNCILIMITALCVQSSVFGQESLRGQVLDKTNQMPLPFVTVFFDGTTIGELTDEDGRFELPMRKIQLPAVLSVSHIGYEPWQMEIGDDKPVKIFLQPSQYEIQTVEVDDLDGRAANVKEFLEQFMGMDSWARESSMEGTEYLFFERENRRDTIRGARARRMRDQALPVMKTVVWSEDGSYFTKEVKRTFTTRARAPLMMDLPHLGYKVQVDLRELYLDYEQGMRVYSGAFFFMPYEGMMAIGHAADTSAIGSEPTMGLFSTFCGRSTAMNWQKKAMNFLIWKPAYLTISTLATTWEKSRMGSAICKGSKG